MIVSHSGTKAGTSCGCGKLERGTSLSASEVKVHKPWIESMMASHSGIKAATRLGYGELGQGISLSASEVKVHKLWMYLRWLHTLGPKQEREAVVVNLNEERLYQRLKLKCISFG